MDNFLGFQIGSIYIWGRVYCQKGLLLVGVDIWIVFVVVLVVGVSISLFYWKYALIPIIHSKSFYVLSLYLGLCLCLYIFCGVNVIKVSIYHDIYVEWIVALSVFVGCYGVWMLGCEASFGWGFQTRSFDAYWREAD